MRQTRTLAATLNPGPAVCTTLRFDSSTLKFNESNKNQMFLMFEQQNRLCQRVAPHLLSWYCCRCRQGAISLAQAVDACQGHCSSKGPHPSLPAQCADSRMPEERPHSAQVARIEQLPSKSHSNRRLRNELVRHGARPTPRPLCSSVPKTRPSRPGTCPAHYSC